MGSLVLRQVAFPAQDMSDSRLSAYMTAGLSDRAQAALNSMSSGIPVLRRIESAIEQEWTQWTTGQKEYLDFRNAMRTYVAGSNIGTALTSLYTHPMPPIRIGNAAEESAVRNMAERAVSNLEAAAEAVTALYSKWDLELIEAVRNWVGSMIDMNSNHASITEAMRPITAADRCSDPNSTQVECCRYHTMRHEEQSLLRKMTAAHSAGSPPYRSYFYWNTVGMYSMSLTGAEALGHMPLTLSVPLPVVPSVKRACGTLEIDVLWAEAASQARMDTHVLSVWAQGYGIS